jgi:hypothetical protein
MSKLMHNDESEQQQDEEDTFQGASDRPCLLPGAQSHPADDEQEGGMDIEFNPFDRANFPRPFHVNLL